MAFIAPENKSKEQINIPVTKGGFIAPENGGSNIFNPIAAEDGSTANKLENSPLNSQVKATQTSPITPYFNKTFKDFGGNDLSGDNISDIIAIEKAGRKIQLDLDFINNPNTTSEQIAEKAAEDIRLNKDKWKPVKQSIAISDFQDKAPEDLAPQNPIADFEKSLENIDQEEKAQNQSIADFYRLGRMKKIGLGYNEKSLTDSKFLDQVFTNLDENFLVNSEIEIANTGNLKKERELKFATNSPYANSNPIVSPVDRQFMLVDGANFQKKSLQDANEFEKTLQAKLTESLKQANDAFGDEISEQEKEYLGLLNSQLNESIQRQLKKTQIIDKIDSIVGANSEDYKKYNEKIAKQNLNLLTPSSISPATNPIESGTAMLKKVFGEELFMGGLNLAERLNDISQGYFPYDYRPRLSDEELSLNDLKYSSRKNQFNSQIGLPISQDKSALLNKELTGFDKKGNFFFNPELLLYNIGKTTTESLLMGTPAAAFESKLAQGMAMALPTNLLFADEIIHSEYNKGLSPRLATGIGLIRSQIEVASEMLNPIEIGVAKGFLKGGIREGEKLAAKELQEVAYRNTIREITGTTKWDRLATALTNSKLFAKEFGKQTSMEYLEEAVSDISNKIPDYFAKLQNKDYEIEDNLNLKSQLTSFITVAATMIPMAGYAANSHVNATINTARMQLGETPKVFLDKLNEDLSKNRITQEQYNQRLQVLNESTVTVATAKPYFDKIDAKDIDQAEKASEKATIFQSLFSINSLKQELITPLSEERKEEIVDNIEKIQEFLVNKYQEISTPISNIQKENKRLKETEEFLSLEFGDEYLSNFQNKEKLLQFKEDFNTAISYETSDKIKELYSYKIDKINQRLQFLESAKEQSSELATPLLTQIKTLLKEELSSFKIPKEIQGEERKSLIQAKVEREKQLEDEENTATFKTNTGEVSFPIGSLVTYEKNNYIVKKDEEGKPFLFNDVTKATVHPSDIKGFEEYKPKDTPKKQETEFVSQETMEDVFGKREEPVSEDIEAKKADIERRRQEEIKNRVIYDREPTIEDGEFQILGDDNLYRVNELTGRVQRFDKEEKIWTTQGTDTGMALASARIQGFALSKEKINAKYDTELATLEQSKEETIVPEQEIVKIEPEVVKEEEKIQEQENKQIEEKNEKKFPRFHPWATIPAFKQDESDPLVKTWINTLRAIKQESFESGKPFEELGYYVTIYDVRDFPNEQFFNSYQEYWKTHEKRGAIGVITDKEAKPILFNEAGKQDSNGKWAISNFNDKMEKPDFTGSKLIKGINEAKWEADYKKLRALRERVKPNTHFTLTISEVITSFPKITSEKNIISKQFTDLPFIDVKKDSTIKDGQGNIYPIATYATKIGDIPNLAESIYDFLNVNNVDPTLPAPFNPASDSKEDKLQAFKNRISFGVPQADINKTFPEIVFWTSSRDSRDINMENDGTPSIFVKSLNKTLTSREEIVEFINSYPLNISRFLNSQGNQSKPVLTIYTWKDNKFIIQDLNYQRFLADNLKVNISTEEAPKFNPFLEFGESIKKAEKKKKPTAPSPEPDLEQPQKETPKKAPAKFKRDIGETLDDVLERHTSLPSLGSLKQNQEAKAWFDEYLSLSGATFNDLRDNFNSSARATWTNSAITLWNTGTYTDLYHEAFHDFTQLFLNKDQKLALYKEAENTVEGKKALQATANRLGINVNDLNNFQKFYTLEELLAEDFLKYKLSDQKLILNQRPKRNSTFRKILNFLKELFNIGNPSIQEVYERLSSQKVRKSRRDSSKALFGKLNSSYINQDIRNTQRITKALDSLLASSVINRNLAFTRIFLEPNFLNKAYNTIYKDLDASFDTLSQKLESSTDELESAEILSILDNLNYLFENWTDVVANHQKQSQFLKVSKDFIPEQTDEEGNVIEGTQDLDEKQENFKDNVNPLDDVALHIKFLIASLPKHQWIGGKKQEVRNQFLPNISDTVNFKESWKLLADTLKGDFNYNSIYSKIETLTTKHPEFKQLLKALPSPTEDLDFYKIQLKNAFINAFSKPHVNIKTTNIEINSEGRNILSRAAVPTTALKVRADWDMAIQEIDIYRTLQPTGQKSVDIASIIKDFPTITPSNSQEFLSSLGFVFSFPTTQHPDFQAIINLENNTLKRILQALKSYKQLQEAKYPNNYIPTPEQIEKFKSPIFSVYNAIAYNLFTKNREKLFQGVKDDLDALILLELQESDKYQTDNVPNSENNNVWLPKNWSLQLRDFTTLNNSDKFPDYASLIASKEGKYFNYINNPDANNLLIHSLFDLKNQGKRRKTKGDRDVKITTFDQNGLVITDENTREGLKTSRLTRFLALVADFPTLLSTGEKQDMRAGDKSTSFGMQLVYPSFVKGETSKANPHIPVDIRDFQNPDVISDQAWFIFKNQLWSALKITNDFYSTPIYSNVAHLPKNIQDSPFGMFDLILSKESKEKLQSVTSDTQQPITKLIEDNEKAIRVDIANFFKEDSKKILREFNSNPLLKPQDYTPKHLLKDYSFEQLVRAFSMNSFIINAEYTRALVQDIRYYTNSKGTYTEIFKRLSKVISSGVLPISDQQNNDFFNNNSNGSFSEKDWYDKTYEDKSLPYSFNGDVNTIILNDVLYTPTDYANDLLERIKKAPQIEQEAVKEKLKDLESTDAFAFASWDFYRNISIMLGNEKWNGEKESLYTKLARREKLSEKEENSANLFFAPLKIRVAGRTYNPETQTFTPVDYKFAITPLIPTVIKGKSFEPIRDNLVRQNIGLALFATASKHSAIVNSTTTKGKPVYNQFYNEEGKPFTGDYIVNPIPVEYFYEVVKQPSEYKEEVRFSTQLRTLLFVNLFDAGKPVDFKESKAKWDALSEEEKKKQSPSYKRATKFSDAIDSIISIKREKLLKNLDAVYNPQSDSYQINEDKFSNLLEEEFNKRNLPFNLIKALQTKEGKFKYPFDATIARDTVEEVILSIIDNQLRKQNSFGEALIQVANPGFEVVTEDFLPFYKALGRDGKFTSAQKVKIALQGDFKFLLQHPDVLQLSSKEKITAIETLNKLIKDESWLSRDNNRKLITLSSVRIPVQGLNSMEFLEVYEFLPSEAGNIIVVSPALVAKSGSDFDWDKLTTLFPNLFIDNNGKVRLIDNLSDHQIEALYDELKEPLKEELQAYNRAKSLPESSVSETFTTTNKLINSIFTPIELKQFIEESFGKGEIPSKKAFLSQYKEKMYTNELISTMREVLEDPNNYINLVLPNATYMFEPTADDINKAKNKETKGYSNAFTTTENLNQHEANFVGKESLGIAALMNKLFPQLQKVGMYLNNSYISNLDFGTRRFTVNRFKHNTQTVNGKEHISVSGVYSQPNLKGDKWKISEAISQIMNGTVDVAKKPWIFDLNIKKELISTQIFALYQGTHIDDVKALFNQPIIDVYLKSLQNYKNPLAKAGGSKQARRAKMFAILDALDTYLKDSKENIDVREYISGQGMVPVSSPIKKVIADLKAYANLDSDKEANTNFYGKINGDFRNLADQQSSLFNPEKYNYSKFAIPEEGKLSKPATEEDKIAQAVFLIQFLEFEEQQSRFQNATRTLNQDTKKAGSLQVSKNREIQYYLAQQTDLLPPHLLEKMANEGYTKAFTHKERGIDKTISQFARNLFDITNHQEFNKFFFSEWNKPPKTIQKKGQPAKTGNLIPFEKRSLDDFDSWITAIKNDFILYVYDNAIYTESTPVISKVKTLMRYDTSLANQLESLKLKFPDLVKNNLFLDALVRDNSRINKSTGKPDLVNLKLKLQKPDTDTSNILSSDFEKLINFNNPDIVSEASKYSVEDRQTISKLFKDVAHLGYVQAGLNLTPYTFTKQIPQEGYAEDIQEVIKALKNYFDKSPEDAQKLLSRFYFSYFRPNNRRFYQSETQVDEVTGEEYSDINFQQNVARLKNFQDPNFPDILKKKEAILSNKLKESSSIKPVEKSEALKNPTTLYLYEQNYQNKYAKGSARIILSDKNTIEKAENAVPIYLYPTPDTLYIEKDIQTLSKNIDTAIDSLISKFKTGKYNSIVIPNNLTEISKLEGNNLSLLATRLKDVLSVQLPNYDFNQKWESPIVNESEEQTNSQENSLPLTPKSEEGMITSLSGSNTEFDKLPSKSLTPTFTYAGIGSRETPLEILRQMTEIAKELESKGFTLNTGKTFGNKEEGADKAFSDGTTKKNLFSPENQGSRIKEQAIAKEIHPAPQYLKGGGLKLMARNTNQVFGDKLDTPVDFVLFYADETSNPLRPKGGTGQAVEMARRKGIPTINMKDADWREQLNRVLEQQNKPEEDNNELPKLPPC